MKRFFLLVFITLLAAGVLLLPVPPAQAAPEPMESGQVSVDLAETVDIDDVHIRDNPSLYADDDPFDVITMYLTVQAGNPSDGTDHTWEEVNSHSAYYYDDLGIDRYKVAATLQIGDENGPLPGQLGYGQTIPNATVQVRGQTSSRNPQKNYKIKLFDNAGTWNGQSTIALNKHQGEGLRFRNKLAFDLLSTIPEIMSLRTQFVHLYVRDLTGEDEGFVDYGLYTQVEQMNKTALNAHGLDKNGQLYKVNRCEFYDYDELKLVTDPDYDEAAFAYLLEPKGSKDHEKLLKLVEAVNDFSLSSDDFLDSYLDRENLAYWMAFMILVGNDDTQNRNFYIYSPLNSSTWYFLPWDNDTMLMDSERDLRNKNRSGSWENGISNYWGNLLFRKALMSASFRSELDAAIDDLRTNYLTREHLEDLAKNYAETVMPYIFEMPDMNYLPLTQENYLAVCRQFPAEVENNYQKYLETLASPMPFFTWLPEQDGNALHFGWDPAFDMAGSEVTYHLILARDYDYQDVLYQESGIRLPETACDLVLEPGQYFLHVDATNTAGYNRNSFDYYVTANSEKVYGTYSFLVREDGSFVPYLITEGDE